MKKPGPRRKTAAGGRVVFDAGGRARDPATKRFLSRRQVSARKVAARKRAFRVRDAAGRFKSQARVLREVRGRREAARHLRVPKGLVGAGRFLPRGTEGVVQFIPLRLAQLQLEGKLRKFVRVRIGGVEARTGPVAESVLRGIMGAGVVRAMTRGRKPSDKPADAEISDLVRSLEELDYEGLEDYVSALELQDVSIEPEVLK